MLDNDLRDDLNTALFELPPDHLVVALRSRTGYAHLGWRKPTEAERLRCAAFLASESFGRTDLTFAERAVLSPPVRTAGIQRILESVELLNRDPAGLTGIDIMADIRSAEQVLAWIAAAQAARLSRLAEPGCAGDPTGLAYAAARLDPDVDDASPASEHWALAGIQQAVGHLGAALTISPISAGFRISDAQDLLGNLPTLHAALVAGTIDPIRARILQQRTKVLRHDDRRHVAQRLMPIAMRHNPGRFSTLVDAAVIEADSDAAEARRQDALDKRGLKCDPIEDGMARFIATLPATDAQLAWDLFDSIAQALKGFDDRCAGHRRADAFSTMIELLAAGHTVSAQSLLNQVLTSECTCSGDDVEPDDTARRNRADSGAEPGVDIAAGSTASASDSEPGEGTSPDDGIDPVDFSDSGAGADSDDCPDNLADGGDGIDPAPDSTANSDRTSDSHLNTDSPSDWPCSVPAGEAKQWSLPTRQGRRTHTTVTVPWDIFVGMRGTVAELAGYGMITAAWAKTLMQAASTVTMLVTDPRTGQTVAVGDRIYRPQQDVRDKVVTAYCFCIFTGCSTHAENCDCEHCQAFNKRHPKKGGPTSIDNLFPVCRQHHRLKTFGGWSYERSPDGIDVTSPLGITTTTRPVLSTAGANPDPSPPPF